MASIMTDIEVLDKAIELLRQGWVRGRSHSVKRGFLLWEKQHFYCASGAVCAAILGAEDRDYTQSDRLMFLLDEKTWEISNQKCGSIAAYNDRHAKDVEDVIMIFEKVKADLP